MIAREFRLCLCTSCVALLILTNLNCGSSTSNNGNQSNNDNDSSASNTNQNSGTGNTINDLPDLGSDDVLGEGEGADVFVPGLILVGFEQSLTEDSFLQRAEATASSLNGELIDVITDLRICSVAVDPDSETDSLALAASLGNVDFAESSYAGRLAEVSDLLPQANSVEFAQYQLFVTDAIRAREHITSGSGNVAVAVLDSGCDLKHPELVEASLYGGHDAVSGMSDIDDDYPGGHGTGVVSLLAAGVDQGEMAGLLSGFDITVHKVADEDGLVTLAAAAKGIVAALNGDADGELNTSEIPTADVINISFSFQDDYQTLSRAIFEAADRGVIVIAASGNNGRSEDGTIARYPAGYSTVIAVGATDIEDQAAPFTNRTPVLEVVAPGVDLLVAGSNSSYRYADGTSFAAAQVSAAAAILLDQEPALSLTELRNRLNARGNSLSSGSGFGSIPVTRLNIYASLLDIEAFPEPYIIPDDQLVLATGVSVETVATSQVSTSSSSTTPEAFSEEIVYWYGYFPGNEVTFELLDGENREELIASAVTSSAIDLFLEFIRGIPLGSTSKAFSVMQQATFTVPDLGGERRPLEIVAVVNGVESDPRNFLYNPLQRGYNITAYKNFDSVVWHLRDEEGESFDSSLADLELLGSGVQPEINWSGGIYVDRVQLGSSLDPDYFVTSEGSDEEDDRIRPPVKLGNCVGVEVPQQVCGEGIGLPEYEIARIIVRSDDGAGFRFASLDVIYVP